MYRTAVQDRVGSGTPEAPRTAAFASAGAGARALRSSVSIVVMVWESSTRSLPLAQPTAMVLPAWLMLLHRPCSPSPCGRVRVGTRVLPAVAAYVHGVCMGHGKCLGVQQLHACSVHIRTRRCTASGFISTSSISPPRRVSRQADTSAAFRRDPARSSS